MKKTELHPIPVTTETLPELTFHLEESVPAGSILRLRADSLRAIGAVELDGISIDSDCTPDWTEVHRHTGVDMRERWVWMCNTRSLVAWKTGGELPAGTLITVSMRVRDPDQDTDCPAMPGLRSFSGARIQYQLGLAPEVDDESFHPVSAPAGYQLLPGPATDRVISRKLNGEVLLTYVDACSNITAGGGGTITLSDGESKISETAGKEDSTLIIQAGNKLDPERPWFLSDEQDRERRIHARPVSLDDTPVWFGEFHWHCEFSGDGNRSLEDSLTSARDELGLDFTGPSDHLNPVTAYYRSEEYSVLRQAEICRSFDDPERFVTLPGGELSGRFGHLNVYSRSWEKFIEVWNDCGEAIIEHFKTHPYRSALVEIADLLPEGHILVPHHTNTDSYSSDRIVAEDGLPFWTPLQWPLPAGGRSLRLAEIHQARGASESETADPDWRNLGNGLGGSLQTALTRGYRIGFTGGTDNHNGWPTRSKDGPICGLTAVMAPTLDTAVIFDALEARRCYATTGARIVADATCNGHPIGSEQTLKAGDPREFRVRVRGTAPLAAVQLIHNNTVLADWPVETDAFDFDTTWRDERPGRPLHGAWYYVRIRQTDGHCAWLSPWWIDLEE